MSDPFCSLAAYLFLFFVAAFGSFEASLTSAEGLIGLAPTVEGGVGKEKHPNVSETSKQTQIQRMLVNK